MKFTNQSKEKLPLTFFSLFIGEITWMTEMAVFSPQKPKVREVLGVKKKFKKTQEGSETRFSQNQS